MIVETWKALVPPLVVGLLIVELLYRIGGPPKNP